MTDKMDEIIFKRGWTSQLKKAWDEAKVRNLDFRGIRNRGQFTKSVGVNAGMELYLGGIKVHGVPLRKHTKVEIIDSTTEESLDVQTSLKDLVDSIKMLMKSHNSVKLEFSGENYIKGDIVSGQMFKEISIKKKTVRRL